MLGFNRSGYDPEKAMIDIGFSHNHSGYIREVCIGIKATPVAVEPALPRTLILSGNREIRIRIEIRSAVAAIVEAEIRIRKASASAIASLVVSALAICAGCGLRLVR